MMINCTWWRNGFTREVGKEEMSYVPWGIVWYASNEQGHSLIAQSTDSLGLKMYLNYNRINTKKLGN